MAACEKRALAPSSGQTKSNMSALMQTWIGPGTSMILQAQRRLPLEVSLLLLSQQLFLEVHHRLQEVFSGHIWRRDDDAAVQEFVHAVQEILSVFGKIGDVMETLRGNTLDCHHWGHCINSTYGGRVVSTKLNNLIEYCLLCAQLH